MPIFLRSHSVSTVNPPIQRQNKSAARFARSTTEARSSGGLPGRLKAGLQKFSGMDLSGVRVHYNAAAPAQINALAYTQGQDIHLGPGQEKHLPHEGWHAVQQLQGRVNPKMQAKDASFNDDADLEREADLMGAKAEQHAVGTAGDVGAPGEKSETPERATGLNAPDSADTMHRGLGVPVIQRFEGPEHRTLGEDALLDLRSYLSTPEGAAWAAANGMNSEDLAERINDDPMAGLSRVVSGIDEPQHLRRPGQPRAEGIRIRSGLELTPGEVIALMGDFYETWHHLFVAGSSEVLQILAVIEQQRLGTISGTDASVEFQRITNGRYIELAERNDPHFATRGGALGPGARTSSQSGIGVLPGEWPTASAAVVPGISPPVTAGNRRAWRQYHTEAIELAQRAPDQLNQALLIDAAGGHFLTDAFAAGHLFDKTELLVEIASYLRAHEIVAEQPRQATILNAIKQFAGASLVLKNVHDQLNRSGFEVTNAQGMSWRTYGDDYLEEATETQRIVSLAVFLSREQIRRAARGDAVDPSEVENLLPDNATTDRATAYAITLIPAAARQIPSLVRSNIDILKSIELEIGIPVLGPAVSWGAQFFGRAYLREQMDPTEGPAGLQAIEGLRRANAEDWSTPNYLFQWSLGSQD